MHEVLLLMAAFLASAVEMVEALTIVLAVGMTRGWRSPTWGVAAAIAALVVIIGVFGSAVASVPIDSLRLLVGTLLLLFGVQWLRKAVLRAGGVKPKHDEDEVFASELRDLQGRTQPTGHDWYAFTIAFKGVFLEGLEVAFIVVTFGGTQHNVGLAALGAAVALIVVTVAGITIHAPLSRVPENSLKFGVGVMLTSFGVFWSGEGAGVSWPGGDLSLLGLVGGVAALSLGLAWWIRRAALSPVPAP